MLVGVTGGIGSGKSRISSLLGKLLGAVVVSADEMCRDFLEVGREGYEQFVRSVGDRFLESDGKINRTRLREAMFSDPQLKLLLESILHPLVRASLLNIAEKHKKFIVIAEVPLLFESGWHHDFDFIVSVYTPETTAIERVSKRDNVTVHQTKKIVGSQLPVEHKSKRADYVIKNDSNWRDTEKQVADLAMVLEKENSV